MPAFEDVYTKNDALVRKALQGTVLLGRHPTAVEITTLSAPDGIIAMPASYENLGWISEDGLTFATDEEVSEVRGWGSSTFIRRDIQSQDKTIAFNAIEDKRLTRELVSGLDLSAVTMSPEGEITYVHPDRPPTKYWRTLALGVDGDGDQRFYFGRFFPKTSVTERDEEAWTDGDDPIAHAVTMGALIDNAVGYVVREFIFGPGALAAAAAMGWTTSTLTAPTGLAPSNQTANSVDLTWDAVAEADHYQVRQSSDSGDTYVDVTDANGGMPSSPNTTVGGLTASTSYRFRVLAVSASGQRGPASPSIEASTIA